MSISVVEAKKELSDLLSKGKLCIFAGSGVSVSAPSSLPTWDGFVEEYIKFCRSVNNLLEDADMRFDCIINDADTYKNRDVVNTITALKDRIVYCKKHGISMRTYDTKMNNMFANKPFNDYHSAIVNTSYRYILTTNYDTLLDEAAEENKHYDLVKRTYSYSDIDKISEAIYLGEPAIIHVHGIASEIVLEEFVLTKDDYKRIKDKNPGFRTLMNSLFMNYSVLMVGYGGSDPHLEDVIDDINLSLGWLDSQTVLNLPIYYLVIKKDKLSPIFDHIKNRNRVKVIAVDDYDEVLILLKELQIAYPRRL
jgi:SepF-like predicted cell division protein (DUF552 family)